MDLMQSILDRFGELERRLSEEAARAPSPAYTALLKEHARLSKLVGKWRVLESLRREADEARALLADPEMRALAQEDLGRLTAREQALAAELERLLEDRDQPAVGALVIEIRPGTGGEEAALFAGDLLRMYVKYIQRKGWNVEILELTQTDLGGVKHATLSVEGEEAWSRLRFESGTHRVQRVPKTEASGRIHTSAATVAVLPEEEEVQFELRKEDLQVDTFAAGGPGGQHVNKTASAIRITHVPTGVVVACQTQRSQHQNRELAMRWLRARIADQMRRDQKGKIDAMRRSQIGTGDRSEKIRTYNFPQSRVTDHRVPTSIHSLEAYLDGEMDPLIELMIEWDRQERRKERAP
jgi:peptide chain release factor 1